MSSGFALHPMALADLEEIRAYIAADDPDAAQRTLDTIEATVRNLVPFPHQGHRRPDLTSRPLRLPFPDLIRSHMLQTRSHCG